jgi:hypothetical protein
MLVLNSKMMMTQETVVFMRYLVQVSVLVGRKTLFLYNLHDPDNPVELAFQQRYGSVVTYKWYVCTLSAYLVFRGCLCLKT